MRRLFFAVIAAALALSGCTTVATLLSTKVPTARIIAAANASNTVVTVATAYVEYCAPKVQPKGCDDALIKGKIIPAVKGVITARNAAIAWVKSNPDATYGPAGLITAITAAQGVLQKIETDNNIAGVVK